MQQSQVKPTPPDNHKYSNKNEPSIFIPKRNDNTPASAGEINNEQNIKLNKDNSMIMLDIFGALNY